METNVLKKKRVAPLFFLLLVWIIQN